MNAALISLHLLIGVAILAAACIRLGNGAQRVSDIRHVAEGEHATKERMLSERNRLQGLLDGLRKQDPYVIELIARDRLDYHRPGELMPPPHRTP
jgi:cell division protein FtsB